MTINIGSQITTITVSSTNGASDVNVPITFGQAFSVGDLPPGAFVELKPPSGVAVPCQFDVKAFHADGSIRHGILSAILPSVPASGNVAYGIMRAASGPSGAAAMPASFAGLNATAQITDNGIDINGPLAGTYYTADAAPLLAAGTYETWLSGPIVSEWILRVALKTAGGVEHRDLHARFMIRAYTGQARARIDYTIENDWAKAATTPANGSPWEAVSVNPNIYTISLNAGSNNVYTRSFNGYVIGRPDTSTAGTYDGNATGLANDATVYTATITANGVAKAISITGSAAQNFGQLKALFNTQLGGLATCDSDETRLGLQFTSSTAGSGSLVAITNFGTLFPALTYNKKYRPIRGDEYIHYGRTRWRKTFWWGATPSVHIAHNKVYLMATGAVPNYSPDLAGDPTEIAAELAAMKANEDIGKNGITKAGMGDYGAAPGIGILPQWASMYLVSQSADAKYTMLKQADLSGSWPCHLRDYAKDKPINFIDWPYATYSPNAGDSVNPATGLSEKLPDLVSAAGLPGNLNVPDVSHHPDMCFLPYLVTGDYYYMEGLLFYQRFTALDENSHAVYRDGRKNLWMVEQPRGQAWAMRTAVHTAYLIPANHPLRDDVLYQIEQNRLWYTNNYVDPAGQFHNPLGYIWHGYTLGYTVGGQANTGGPTWMDAFITSATGRAVELGFTEYLPFLQFKSKFPVGTLTSGSDFCWQWASAYTLKFRDTAASPLYTTFKALYLASVTPEMAAAQCGTQAMTNEMIKDETCRNVVNSMYGYPDIITGYPANIQPAVAYAASYGAQGGADAWMVFDNRALKPNYNLGPQFDIIPRAASISSPPVDPTPDPQPIVRKVMSFDRVNTTTTSTGTGTMTVSSTATRRYLPLSSIPIGTLVALVIEDENGDDWEESYCTVLSATTFSRDTVIKGSNGASKVNFGAGTKTVFATLTADQINAFLTASSLTGAPAVTTVADPTAVSLLTNIGGVVKQITAANFLASVGVTAAQLPAVTAANIAGANILEINQPTGDGGATVDAMYTYLVNRMTAAGLFSGSTSTPAPGQVTGLAAGTATSTTQDLSWTAVSGATSYKVEKSAAGANTWTVANASVTGTSYTVTGLTASTNYDYRVTASNATGPGTPSSTVTKSTTAASAQAITVATPATQTVGTPFTVTGTYANGAPTALDYRLSDDTAGAWTQVTTATISGGTFSFSVTPSTASAGRTISVRDRSTLVSGTSGSYVVNAAAPATSYTIAGYNGNTVKGSIDASSSGVFGSLKLVSPIDQFTDTFGYFTISPTPPSDGTAMAYAGWVPAGSAAPTTTIASGANVASGSSINGLTQMDHPGAFKSNNYLVVPNGSGTSNWDFYVKASDGVAQKMGTATVTGA